MIVSNAPSSASGAGRRCSASIPGKRADDNSMHSTVRSPEAHMPKPKLSVIVLNWNGKQFLETCFRSLAQQTYPRANVETLFVDNGSTDGSTTYVRTHFPWVKVLSLPKNVGFAKGNHYGIHHA